MPEGVVHAFDTIHTALRPGGLLLDVRPAPLHPWVVVQHADADAAGQGRRMERLGQVDDSYRVGTLDIADAALQAVIDAGRFARERSETFTFRYHFDSAGCLLDYMAQHWSTAHLGPEVVARAEKALSEGTSDLQVHRVIHATRLRRLDTI